MAFCGGPHPLRIMRYSFSACARQAALLVARSPSPGIRRELTACAIDQVLAVSKLEEKIVSAVI
jgi:hypothetical protein